MKKSDIFIGLKFKPSISSNIEGLYGVVSDIKDNTILYDWISIETGDYKGSTNLKIDKFLQCFEYYGYIVLTPLEQELL
jgi:hypothetical protein